MDFASRPLPMIPPLSSFLIVPLLGLAIQSVLAASPDTELALVPWPEHVTLAQGQLVLSQQSRVLTEKAALAPLAEILSAEIRQTHNLRLATGIGPAGADDIGLMLDPALKGEAYVLEVTDTKATVRGANYNAVAMGTVTLLQALRQSGALVTLPALTVNDQPQSTYCGTMVDVARRYNSIDSLKQIVLMCRLYKIRFLHLHLTDDQAWTFPSKTYPQL